MLALFALHTLIWGKNRLQKIKVEVKAVIREGERLKDTWKVYFLVKGKRLHGDLAISDRALYFKPKFEVTYRNMFFHDDFVDFDRLDKDTEIIRITKEDIISIEAKKSVLKKKVILLLKKEPREVVIDYGMLSIDKMVQALEDLK